MAEPYGMPPGTAINYGALGFPAWVDRLCSDWGLDSSTYPGHQESDRPDIGAAPNPNHENRGIDWAGDPQRMLDFARWCRDNGPPRTSGRYGPPGLEMVIFQDPRTGERVWYPSFVDYGSDFGGHTDHVHTRFSASVIDVAPPTVMTVPLTPNPDGTWTSPSPAWAHLIMRESSGNPTIIQQIIDVNSGGNEAEGLFQITPRTWRAHGGEEFAPSARLATPQQQAIVAARIFTRNPSGSDWGAGLPGREDPAELAAGLVPLTQPVEEGPLMALSPEEQRELLDRVRRLSEAVPSKSRYADDRPWDTTDFVRNIDGHMFDLICEHNAALGDQWSLTQIQAAAARGDQIAARFLDQLTAAPGPAVPPAPIPTPAPQPTPPPAPPTPTPPPQPTPPPLPAPAVKPVLYCVNGFMGDMWIGPPADVGHALEDVAYFQPVGFAAGAFPLGIGRDDGVRELKRLIRDHQARNPGRRFAFFGFSLGAAIVDDVFDDLRSGDMQQFWPYFVGGAKIGDPRREPHKWWGGPDDPGGVGIAGPRNLKNTPDNFRSYMYDNNKGDIYANAGINPLTGQFDQAIADDMTMIYQFVMTEWDGVLVSLFAEAAELITKLGPTGVTIVMSIWNGIQFLIAGQAPHMNYPLDDAIAFLRSLLV